MTWTDGMPSAVEEQGKGGRVTAGCPVGDPHSDTSEPWRSARNSRSRRAHPGLKLEGLHYPEDSKQARHHDLDQEQGDHVSQPQHDKDAGDDQHGNGNPRVEMRPRRLRDAPLGDTP